MVLSSSVARMLLLLLKYIFLASGPRRCFLVVSELLDEFKTEQDGKLSNQFIHHFQNRKRREKCGHLKTKEVPLESDSSVYCPLWTCKMPPRAQRSVISGLDSSHSDTQQTSFTDATFTSRHKHAS